MANRVWQGMEVKVFGGIDSLPRTVPARRGSPAQVLYPDPELVESWRRINVEPSSVEPLVKAFSQRPEEPYLGKRRPGPTSTNVQDDLRRQADERHFSSDDPFRDAVRSPLPAQAQRATDPRVSVSWPSGVCVVPQPPRAPLATEMPVVAEEPAPAAAPPIPAGLPAAPGAPSPTFKSGVLAVAVPIVARGPGGERVPLAASDLRVYEDGVEQKVAELLTDAAPLHVALLLDVSDSMRARLESVRAAAASIVDALRPDDSVMVASFAGRTLVHTEWTRDPAAAREAILRVRSGSTRGTRLYDAMDVMLAERLASLRGRTVLIVLTDGLDVESEWATGRTVLERVQSAGLPVYALQYRTSADPRVVAARVFPKGTVIDGGTRVPDDELAQLEADRFLDAVTRASGGRVLRAAMPDEIASAFESLAAEVRRQFVLYYYPSVPSAPNVLHAIRVEANRPGVTIRTRTGYRAR